MSARDLSVVAALWVVNGKGYRIAAEKDREALMRLAELGAKCLEILTRAEPRNWIKGTDFETIAAELFPELRGAARSLGLLSDDDDGRKA